MKIKLKNILYLGLLGLCTPATFAQQSISLEQCRQMALEHSETMQMADKNVEKAQAEKLVARSYYLPSLSASGNLVYLKDDFSQDLYMPTYTPNMTTGELDPNLMINPQTGAPVIGADGNPVFNMYAYLPIELSIKGAYMAGVNLDQPLFTGGKIMAGNKMARIGESMAQTNKQWATLKTITEADQVYWMYVMVDEKVKLAGTAVTMLDSLVQRVENSFETGMVQKNELLKVQVKYNQAKLDLQKANNGLQLVRMSLCRVIGLPFNTPIVATDTTINCTADLLKTMGSSAVSERPEYKLMNQQVAMEDEKIKLIRADYLPTLGVRASYSQLGGVKFSGTDLGTNNFMIMGSLKIPLFHWGEGKQKVASARIDRDLKALELQQNAQLMQLEIEQTKFNLQDAYLRVQIAEESLQQANENLRLSQNNYELGAELMTDLLIAQTQWQQAKAEVIEAKTDFKLKETLYLKAIGQVPGAVNE